MSVGGTLAGLAAGAALARRLTRTHHAEPRAARWTDLPSRPLEPSEQDPEACPGCGADAMTLGYEEEVDFSGRGVDVLCCFRCGWKRALPPL